MHNPLKSLIQGRIEAVEVEIGKGVVVEPGALITGKRGPARKVVLGDFCFIGHDTRIIAPEFRLGDYSKLHMSSLAHGEKPMQIGRNCWIGGNTVLDSNGGLDILDNVGIGAHSQIWTHVQFGDIVEGCRFYSRKYMCVNRDAWFVGHCLVSAVRVGERSMALLGSVITDDMLPNHIYAGVPAKDVSPKMGYQFERRSVEQKTRKLQELIDRYTEEFPEFRNRLALAQDGEKRRDGVCYFDVTRRSYTQTYSVAEISFLKAHVPLIKFIPEGKPDFVVPQQQVEPFPIEADAW